MKPPWEEDFDPVDDDLPVIPGRMVHETAKAVLWRTDDDEQHWIPKSQIKERKRDSLTVTRWFIEQSELEAYEV